MTDKPQIQRTIAQETEVLTSDAPKAPHSSEPTEEIGGPKGPEPTRYGDWEVAGRCSDF